MKGSRLTWDKWCQKLLGDESLPVDVAQPLVIFDLVRAAEPQSIGRLSLEQFVDEVCGLHGPAVGYVRLPQVDLLGEDLVANVLPRFPRVGPPSQHEFVSDHAQSEIVNLDAVVLATHNFGCHVAWRARGIMRVVRRPDPRDAHVGYAHVAVRLKQQVFRLDVAMNHTITVHVLQPHNYASYKEFGLLLCKALFFVMVISQVAPSHQICDQVNILEIDKSVEHVDEEGVFELREQFAFVYDRIDRFFVNYAHFRHFFHGVHRLKLFTFYLPYAAEAALSNHTVELKVRLSDG